MSILAKLRPLLFSNLRSDMDPNLRKATWDVFNAVDSDLDIANYTDNESSTTDEAMERLEAVMSGVESKIPLIDDEDILPDNPIESDNIPEERVSHIPNLDDDDLDGN